MEIYWPAEDSYLMAEELKKEVPKLLKSNSKIKFLEIGCGSGINLQTAFEMGIKKENILGVDVNKEAVEHCKKMGFNCIGSDLFEKVKEKYDLIVFNPPYLPLNKKEPKDSRISTTGGRIGNEITVKFLRQSKNYLNKNGEIFLITSSLSKEVNFKKFGYKPSEISSKNLFFEKISLWRLRISKPKFLVDIRSGFFV